MPHYRLRNIRERESMERKIISAMIIALSLIVAIITPAIDAQSPNDVCPDPAAPCQHKQKRFERYELSFRLPSKLKKTAYKSSVFYGIVLETIAEPECDEGETSSDLENKRRNAQAFFPDHKAFADHQCPNLSAVAYVFDGESNTRSFHGVYAGETIEEAEEMLEQARERYPEASIKKMQVVFDYSLLFQ